MPLTENKITLLKKKEDHLRQLILDTEKELVFAEVNEWIYTQEAIYPKNMGKERAETALAEYQKHIGFLKQKIEILRMYAKNYNLQI